MVIRSAVKHIGINMLKNRRNFNVNVIVEDVMNIALHCRSRNIATVFISSIVCCTNLSYTIIQKLNELLPSECTNSMWSDGIHLLESGKAIIANNLIKSIDAGFSTDEFSSADKLTDNCSEEKCRKNLGLDNFDKSDKNKDSYGYFSLQVIGNFINEVFFIND